MSFYCWPFWSNRFSSPLFYHIVSHHIILRPIPSYWILLYHIIITLYQMILNPIVSQHVALYRILSSYPINLFHLVATISEFTSEFLIVWSPCGSPLWGSCPVQPHNCHWMTLEPSFPFRHSSCSRWRGGEHASRCPPLTHSLPDGPGSQTGNLAVTKPFLKSLQDTAALAADW